MLVSVHLTFVAFAIEEVLNTNAGNVAQIRDMACFYRAMHYSAKRGLAITCRLSVRLSVTLVDHDHIG